MVNTTSKFIDEEFESGTQKQLLLNGNIMGTGKRAELDYAQELKFDPNYAGKLVDTPIFGTRQIANPDFIAPSATPPPTIPQPTNPGGFLPGSAFMQPAQAVQNARQFQFQSPGMFGNQKFMGADPFGYQQPGPGIVPALPSTPGVVPDLPQETNHLLGGGK